MPLSSSTSAPPLPVWCQRWFRWSAGALPSTRWGRRPASAPWWLFPQRLPLRQSRPGFGFGLLPRPGGAGWSLLPISPDSWDRDSSWTVGLPWLAGSSGLFYRLLWDCWSSAAGGRRSGPPCSSAPAGLPCRPCRSLPGLLLGGGSWRPGSCGAFLCLSLPLRLPFGGGAGWTLAWTCCTGTAGYMSVCLLQSSASPFSPCFVVRSGSGLLRSPLFWPSP